MEKSFNRFTYYIALPVFIFLKSAESPALDGEAFKTSSALFLVTLALMICGTCGAMLLRLPTRSTGTFIQGTFRANLAYIGLPVLAYALKDQAPELQQKGQTLAILTMAPGVFFYNILAVTVLEWARRHELTGHPLLSTLRSTFKNPLIISCILGFGWNALQLPVPELLSDILQPVSQTAFPLALLAIGARIAVLSWKKGLTAAIGVMLLKNGAGLLFGMGMCHLLGVEGLSRLVILVLSSCPTAVASYVLVDQLNGDRDLAASSIAVSHVGSMISLAFALWIGLPL